MDYRRGESGYSNPNVVQINPGNTANDNYGSIYGDDAIWATEEDYGAWNSEASMDARTQLGMEPPEKRSRNSQSLDLNGQNRSKAIGKMFYKTKLCCKFRAGTCPYITNCNFAHSVEELRKPPPNWQDIVANHDEERGVSSEPREEYQIPILGVNDDSQRSYKGRRCKKFYTEEGCPYGDSCTFLHDEQSRARESVAISLGPGPGPGPGAGGAGGGNNVGSVVNLKPSNWKTRICNKWELTGYCPFGSKCHFAHGAAELNHYGGGAMDSEQKDPSMVDVSSKQGTAPSLTAGENVVAASVPSLPQNDGYHHVGVSAQRISNALPRNGGRANQKWKGPDKISKIYGDWIDDL